MTDIHKIRQALASLPRAEHHRPGQEVHPEDMYVAPSHRLVLDPERPIVVGNRGMGKSFWAHALVDATNRTILANHYRIPALLNTDVVLGYNASDRIDGIAPTPEVYERAAMRKDPIELWRAIVVRAVATYASLTLPERFEDVVTWVSEDAERYAKVVTAADDELVRRKRRMLIVFDALDRIGTGMNWTTTRARLQALLRLTLTLQSFRSVRCKLFLRLDQIEGRLLQFPDASKLWSTHAMLEWQFHELYELLFHRLRATPEFCETEKRVLRVHGQRAVVESLGGVYMGINRKQGYVFTWVPTHLADALGQISPRTFLTAWREAALHEPWSGATPVDRLGLLEGVRRASEDRLSELAQDYPWVRATLEPLKGYSVPIEHQELFELWRASETIKQVSRISQDSDILVLLPETFRNPDDNPEAALLEGLKGIGVCEVRKNGKVDVPDIFRVEAGIKRRGGVKPPPRSSTAR